jgi:hypothetical protein
MTKEMKGALSQLCEKDEVVRSIFGRVSMISIVILFRKYTYCSLMMLIISSCTQYEGDRIYDDFRKAEKYFGTGGSTSSRYHNLAKFPQRITLDHPGFIIGIEKTSADIGYPSGSENDPIKNLDYARFRAFDTPSQNDQKAVARYKDRRRHLARRVDDTKKMIVSHILAYHTGSPQLPSAPRFIHNIYPNSGLPIYSDLDPGNVKSVYEDGWTAITRKLEQEITKELNRAAIEDREYTHIVVLAMGWNNDQEESVFRYNSIISNTIAASKGEFRPLTIGFTWPSVWGGESFIGTLNLLGHLFSYVNKPHDADEIGYTIANYLVNRVIPSALLKRNSITPNAKVVLIGHSLGARLLTRAALSKELLKDTDNANTSDGSKVDLILGLQGAFSANRFIDKDPIIFPLNCCFGEGWPYWDHSGRAGKIVLTWSREDTANPFARLASGARHVGGTPGYNRACSNEGKPYFRAVEWPSPDSLSDQDARSSKAKIGCKDDTISELEKCDALFGANRLNTKAAHVDVTSFVRNHNDVLDDQMGRFIWETVHCLDS